MLLIDNYDSYTYNLFQLMCMVNGGKEGLRSRFFFVVASSPRRTPLAQPSPLSLSLPTTAQPVVLHNDAIPWPELRSRILAKEWDGVVISPGPGTPLLPEDVGVCAPLLAEAAAAAGSDSPSSSAPSAPASPSFPPILGVCLGMQALAHACGGVVQPAPEPVHGRLSLVAHCGSSPLFVGVPRYPLPEGGEEEEGAKERQKTEEEARAGKAPPAFRVVRYHSLSVEESSLPACLRATAWTVGGTVAVETKSARKARVVPPLSAAASPSSPSAPPLSAQRRVLMALEHESLPLFGVQFHPESIATSYGDALFANFRDLVAEKAGVEKGRFFVEEGERLQPPLPPPGPPTPAAKSSSAPPSSSSKSPFPCPAPSSTLELCWERVEGCLESAGGTESLFLRLFNTVEGGGAEVTAYSPPPPSFSSSEESLRLLDHGAPDVWWLDTSTSDRGRFSFMGGGPSGGHAGPLWSRAVYRLGLPGEKSGGKEGKPRKGGGGGGSSSSDGGTLSVTTRDGASTSTSLSASVFEALERQLRACARGPDPALPFDFQGGFVALLGYELKAECGGEAAHSAAAVAESGGEGTATPDAAFYFADRMLAADHRTGDVYCLALYEQREKEEEDRADSEKEGEEASSRSVEKREALSWVSRLSSRVRSLAAAAAATKAAAASEAAEAAEPLPPPLASVFAAAAAVAGDSPPPIQPFKVRRGKSTYLADVSSCLGALARGESYELCLTTRLERAGPPPPALALYRTLRRGNPAPYSAFVALGGDSDVSSSSSPSSSSSSSSIDGYCGPRICCSSPERFLRGDSRGRLEARPIKGTARRVLSNPGDDDDDERAAAAAADAAVAAALASSEKDRAENLMIVDLLRNDLGRVSEPGSVSVPGLMEVETFATVHQLVSTVVGIARGMGSEENTERGWARAVAAHAAADYAAAAAAAQASPPPPPLLEPKEEGRQEGAARAGGGTMTSAVTAVRAAFPGGSMTGAPKVRSMALLDALEEGARGIYSGSLGYLSTTGAFDLNIVIRTAVVLPRAAAEAAADEAAKMTTTMENGSSSPPKAVRLLPPGISIGAGGAVVLQSTPEGEYEEMLLKAGALLAAVIKVSSTPSSTSSSSSPVEVEVED